MKLQITMDVYQTDPLATGPPPSLVIYEQTSHFTGTVTWQGGQGTSALPFAGDGFREYTAISSIAP